MDNTPPRRQVSIVQTLLAAVGVVLVAAALIPQVADALPFPTTWQLRDADSAPVERPLVAPADEGATDAATGAAEPVSSDVGAQPTGRSSDAPPDDAAADVPTVSDAESRPEPAPTGDPTAVTGSSGETAAGDPLLGDPRIADADSFMAPADVAQLGAGDVESAVDVLTRTDDGQLIGLTFRWVSATVPVQLTGPAAGDPHVGARVDRILAWMTDTTGTTFTRTSQPAAYTVRVDWSDDRPRCQFGGVAGVIDEATVTVSATRERWMWEELVQCAGPFGDHGPLGRSIFDQAVMPVTPTGFDRAVIETLYNLPAGASRDQVRAALPVS